MLLSAVLISLVSSDRCAWPTCPDSSRQPRATRPRPTSLRQHLWAGPTASEPSVGVAVNALRRSLIRPRGDLLFFPPLAPRREYRVPSVSDASRPSFDKHESRGPAVPIDRQDQRDLGKLR